MAATSGFDASERLRVALHAALQKAGIGVVHVPVVRDRRRATRPIARDELPYPPAHAVYLDATLTNLWCVAYSHASKYEPAARLSYRLVSDKGVLLRASRNVVAHRSRSWLAADAAERTATFVAAPRTAGELGAGCAFSVDEAVASPARVWECFDDAFAHLAEYVARDLAGAEELER